jgi:hypothetical protein
LLITLVTDFASSSPHPGLSTEHLLNKQKGLFLLPHGFKMSFSNGWDLQINPESGSVLEAFQKKRSWPRMLVTKTKLKADSSIESYTKKWIQNYSSYGFEIAHQKIFQMGDTKAIAIDLKEINTNIMARQYIQVKNKIALVITCSDEKDFFAAAIKECNQVIQSFEWTKSPETSL